MKNCSFFFLYYILNYHRMLLEFFSSVEKPTQNTGRRDKKTLMIAV